MTFALTSNAVSCAVLPHMHLIFSAAYNITVSASKYDMLCVRLDNFFQMQDFLQASRRCERLNTFLLSSVQYAGIVFVEMASRITLQVGRHVLRGSTRMPIRLLSTLTSSTKFISAQNNHSLFSVNRQSASFLHTSAVVSSSHIVTIQDEKDFDARVLQNEKPVLVDFFATYVTFLLFTVCQCKQLQNIKR